MIERLRKPGAFFNEWPNATTIVVVACIVLVFSGKL